MILLQSAPSGFDYESVINKLKKVNLTICHALKLTCFVFQVEGIVNVHELHAWQLSDAVAVASLHISGVGGMDAQIISQAKDVLHNAGVHSSTIQFEVVSSPEVTIH
jgi:Co/Zn/Cd efflux system component